MARVLIVDDDPVSRVLLRHILERGGHEVVEAADGHEALAALRHDSVDLIISDERMPGLTGSQLRQALGPDLDVPFALLTGSVVDAKPSSEARIDRFIHKPIGTSVVTRTVDELVERLS